MNDVVYRHEHANGYYRVSVYFVAKILFDLVPLRVIPAIPFSAIVYYMMGTFVCFTVFYCELCYLIDGLTSVSNMVLIYYMLYSRSPSRHLAVPSVYTESDHHIDGWCWVWVPL